MNRSTSLFVLLIVILFIFPATVVRYAQAASATSAMKNNATASANMTENNANMTGKSTENNATASANMTVNQGPIVSTPKENTTSPMKNTASPTYGCQWPIPAGEGHVICAPQ